MLKVLIISPFSLEYGRGGELSSIELATGLQKYFKITLIDTNRLLSEKAFSDIAIKKKLKGLKVKSRIKFATIKVFNRNLDFPFPWEVLRLYRTVKKNDIIYFSTSNFKMDLILMMFSLLHRQAKFIIGYRKPLYSEKLLSLYNFKYRLSILFFSLFKRRFYHHTISYHAKKFLDNFYNPKKVIHIIHGINLKFYKDKEIKKRKNDTLKFLYVGYLDDVHKGIGVLLNAIEQLLENNRNLKLSFEFCGVGPLESELKKLEKKFPQLIKYNGYVSNDNISQYYKRNDIFLFSSRREPFGRVIVEALAAQLLILCTKTYGSIEILSGKDFAFFFRELSIEAIIDKIIEVYNLWINNPKKFKILQKSAKEYAFQNYAFSKELEMFKSLINKFTNT